MGKDEKPAARKADEPPKASEWLDEMKARNEHAAAMLREAAREIDRLRARVERAEAQVRVVEVFERALFGLPLGMPRETGASVDFAWSLRNLAREIAGEEQPGAGLL